jgi:hypothetical protein
MKKSMLRLIWIGASFLILQIPSHAQWIQTNGPYGGRIQCIAVSGTNLFAGTGNGEIYLSTNNGTSWTAVNTGLTNWPILALAVSGTNLFAGSEQTGVFLSTNNGTNWTAVNTGLTNKVILTLAVSGKNLFAGTEGGVFLSTNNGTNWTEVNTGLTNTVVRTLAVSGTNLFAGTEGGVFLSTNNGTNWTEVNAGLTNKAVRALTVSGKNLFAGTYGIGSVFLSTNNGTSWTAVNTGLTNIVVLALAVSGTNLFAGTEGGVFLSTNNGTSWTETNTGLTNTSVCALTISGTDLFAGTDGGIFLSSNNGINWTTINTGLTNTHVNAFTVSGTDLFTGTYGSGVFRSTNNGTNWTAVNAGLSNMYVLSLAVSGTDLFAGTYDGIFLSTNNGASWTAVNTGISTGSKKKSIYAIAESGTNLFVGAWNGGVFLSTNNGTSWTAVNNGINTGSLNASIFALAVSGTDIFAGTNQGGVFHSTNNGTIWTEVNTGLTNKTVNAFTVSGTNLFAATSGGDGGVFLSTNNGASWRAVNEGLPKSTVLTLAVSGTNLFAGTWYGLFLSTNNGTSWTAVNTGLNSNLTSINALAVSGPDLFAGTHQGVWRRPLAEMLPFMQAHTLDITKSGSGGGQVKVNDVPHTIPYSNGFTNGENITLEAIPDTSSLFQGWSAFGSTLPANPYSFTMPDSDIAITARFGSRTITQNRALRLKAGGDYAEVAHSSILSPPMITCECWFSLDGHTGEQTLLDKRGDNGGYNLRVKGNHYPLDLEAVLKGSVENYLIVSGVIQAYTWYHAAATYDGSVFNLYLDGELAASTRASANITGSTVPLLIGEFLGYPGASLVWHGLIDELRIWNIARDQAGIRADMNRFLTGGKSGLAGLWKMEETGGDVFADSGPNHLSAVRHGTAKTVPSTAPIENEAENRALRIDQEGARAVVAYAGVLSPANLTIECWLKKNNDLSYEYTIVDHRGGGSGYNLRLAGETFPLSAFLAQDGTPQSMITGGGNCIESNVWQHVAATYDGQAANVYIDGELAASQNGVVDMTQSTAPLMIGEFSGYPYPGESLRLNGDIDELRIWNVARGKADIQNLMYKSLSGLENGLAGYWRFNETGGSLAYDKSENENNATVYDPALFVPSEAPVDTLSTGVIEVSRPLQERPENSELLQNYPNPFNSETAICFRLTETTKTFIRIYDIKGRLIRRIDRGFLQPGFYKVIWDGKYETGDHAPSGIFTCELTAGPVRVAKKMLLIK